VDLFAYIPFVISVVSILNYPSWLLRARIAVLGLPDDLEIAVTEFTGITGMFVRLLSISGFNSAYVVIDFVRRLYDASWKEHDYRILVLGIMLLAFVILAVIATMSVVKMYASVNSETLRGREADVTLWGRRVRLRKVLTGGAVIFTLVPALFKYLADTVALAG
jgi:hypothetical protein